MMRFALLGLIAGCASAPRPFPLRPPLTVDTDTRPVSVPCRPDPTKKEPHRVTCAPEEYVSPFVWDQIDNVVFARLSRAFSLQVAGEAVNATSLDEVADSAWFENRIGAHPLTLEQRTIGACKPEDLLPIESDVADGTWVIDHGKDDGSTPGFRIDVPGKGQYMLKADDTGQPERASAASVIGAAIYNAAGFYTTCEQVVVIRPSQLKLTPGLTVTSNEGIVRPFDDKALAKVLEGSTQVGKLTRMQASKWLPGLALGPFRYVGTRSDDPNDVIRHDDRRELRGSRLLAAWLAHWDAREQNTMDIWLASDPKQKRSSPGFVRHFILDTSDVIGGAADPVALAKRLGYSYNLDFRDVLVDLVTLGIVDRPWDRAHKIRGREKFAFFSAHDFDPERWICLYPNPAMLRMTERDGAWMARIIAHFTPEDVHAISTAGRFSDPADADYLATVLLERRHKILARYLTRLSPLADVHTVAHDQLCAVDLARFAGVLPADRYHYQAVERFGGRRIELPVTVLPDGVVCFQPRSLAPTGLPDDSHERIAIFELRNGTSAGPLEVHAYDLGTRGMFVAGLVRPNP